MRLTGLHRSTEPTYGGMSPLCLILSQFNFIYISATYFSHVKLHEAQFFLRS